MKQYSTIELDNRLTEMLKDEEKLGRILEDIMADSGCKKEIRTKIVKRKFNDAITGREDFLYEIFPFQIYMTSDLKNVYVTELVVNENLIDRSKDDWFVFKEYEVDGKLIGDVIVKLINFYTVKEFSEIFVDFVNVYNNEIKQGE